MLFSGPDPKVSQSIPSRVDEKDMTISAVSLKDIFAFGRKDVGIHKLKNFWETSGSPRFPSGAPTQMRMRGELGVSG